LANARIIDDAIHDAGLDIASGETLVHFSTAPDFDCQQPPALTKRRLFVARAK
jgi:hypothetical protein